VNWARWLDVDPETALRRANRRFAQRFEWLESEARRQQVDIARLSPEQLDELWQSAKSNVRD